MCGIAGFLGMGMSASESGQVLKRMLTRIKHRGPDESGMYISPEACMGNVRLSIVDLATGQQPLCDDSGAFWIVFNGEIFNYRELRLDLERRGCRFTTHSDTEVFLLAYREYGVKCLHKLNGQFAVAIWDVQAKSLFVARDRLGIRPLFYTMQNDHLVFASEIKSLFEFPGLNRSISHEALEQIFTFWTALTPRTAFSRIQELPPGHYMIYSNGNSSLKKYWDIDFCREEKGFAGTFHEAGEQLEFLLSKAVRLRLRADVPVGSYLSGGLDSSVIASLIRDNRPDDSLQTFSVGFTDRNFDESAYQSLMVTQLGTKHHQVGCGARDIAERFSDAVWHAETPLLRTAPVPMMLLSQLVRENGIKVVMTGEGADEILGGYNIFKEMIIRRFWAKQPASHLRPQLLSRLYPYLSQMNAMGPTALKLFFGYRLQNTESPLYSHLLRWNNTSRITKLLTKVPDAEMHQDAISKMERELGPLFSEWSSLAKAQYLESKIFMSGYLLSSQGDRMGMANGVEGRYPFLDHHVVEFCNLLPDDYKLNGLKEKVLLKYQFNDRLPKAITHRAKQAYRAPLAAPFMEAMGTDYYRSLLSDSSLKESGLFDSGAVHSLIKKMQRNSGYSEVDQMALVAVISSQILHEKFIKGFDPLPDSALLKPEIYNEKEL